MTISENVGSVATLWRFPVKSMGGEQLSEAEVTKRGVLGDRAYALIDKDTGKVVSAKSVRLFPNLLHCKAAFVEAPRRGGDLPPVQILLPDNTTVRSDSDEVDRVLSAYFKRNVTLGRPAQVPHERDRRDRATWIRRERLGRSRARVWCWGTAQCGATRSPMCDDDACSGRSPPGYGRPSDTRWPQPGASRRSRTVSLRRG